MRDMTPSEAIVEMIARGNTEKAIGLSIGVSQVRTRKMRERAGGPPPTLPMWCFPWLSYVAIVGMAMVLIAMAIMPSHRDEFWTSMVSIGATLLAYRLFRHGRVSARSSTEAAKPRAGVPQA